MNDAVTCLQRNSDRLILREADGTLKSVCMRIAMQASMFEHPHLRRAWHVDHAAVVWANVLQRHPKGEGCMIIFRIEVSFILMPRRARAHLGALDKNEIATQKAVGQ